MPKGIEPNSIWMILDPNVLTGRLPYWVEYASIGVIWMIEGHLDDIGYHMDDRMPWKIVGMPEYGRIPG